MKACVRPVAAILAITIGLLVALLPTATHAETTEACSIIMPDSDTELTYAGPGAAAQCASMLQTYPGTYPTNRPPDIFNAVGSLNGVIVVVGTAFAPVPFPEFLGRNGQGIPRGFLPFYKPAS